MKKKLVFLLLACLMLCVAVPAAMAEDEPNPATDFVYTETGDGSITIRGYNGTDPTVVIPSEIDGKPVTVIANSTFKDCTSLASITIPDSVTGIGNSAFENCTSLESVIIPNSVTRFEQGVFVGCTNLKSVTLPGSITSIPNLTFKDCTSLASITIPDSVTAIGQSAFENCTSLASVTLPNSVTAIGNTAFQGCISLTSVEIPSSATAIPQSAFNGCTSLESVTLPDGIISISNSAFRDCTSLKNIIIPNSVTVIGNNAFRGCTSLKSVIIPESVTEIESYVFRSCTNLTTIDFVGENPPDIGSFWCDPATVNVIYVPHDAVADYRAAVRDGSADKVRCKTHNVMICHPVITVSVSPADSGSAAGGGTYNHGDTVTLTATPITGYTFAGWQVNGQIVSTSQTYTFTAVKDVTVTALFTLNDYVVTVSASTGGKVQGGGSYHYGDIVTLTAVPDNGYSFAGWYVNNQFVSTDAAYTFTVTEEVTLTAVFALNEYSVIVGISPAEGGIAGGAGVYKYGDAVTLEAIPNAGYRFVGWQLNGRIVSTDPTYSFTAIEDADYTALFALKAYVISANAQPQQGGIVMGGGTYHHGDTVTLTATPEHGYYFAGWHVNNQLVSTEAAYSFTAAESISLTALFEKIPELPQTGDDSQMMMWLALACVSLLGFSMLVRMKKDA